MLSLYQMRPVSLRVLVVGETCSDIFVYGSASRLCPDVPAPVFKTNKTVLSEGMAGNTKRNLEALGIEVDLISQQKPITKTRYVDEKLNYTFLRVDEENSIDQFDNSVVTNDEISSYDAVVISRYKSFMRK